MADNSSSTLGAEFPAAERALDEYNEIEQKLSDPAVHAEPGLARSLGRKYAALGQVVQAYKGVLEIQGDLEASIELADLDPAIKATIPDLESKFAQAKDDLRTILIPRDPDDAKDAIIEIKAGAGGEESALFAGDLLRMYQKYADKMNWKIEMLDESPSDIGGYKDLTMAIRSKENNVAPADGVWAHFKYEGGVHRVQRVPVTESQGRIHTSATAVYSYPEADEVEEDIEIPENEIRVDVFRAGGPGGQCVNTTDSAVRLTHIPTGIVVSMQNEKSQIQNRAAALKILKSRLIAKQHEEQMAAESDMRMSQVRNADRSERIRTYNFPENRINDHRTNYKAYNLDAVMNGDLEALIDSAISADEQARLDAQA